MTHAEIALVTLSYLLIEKLSYLVENAYCILFLLLLFSIFSRGNDNLRLERDHWERLLRDYYILSFYANWRDDIIY